MVRNLLLRRDITLLQTNARDHRATTSHIFSAAVVLALEAKSRDFETAASLRHDVARCVAFFDRVGSHNLLAAFAKNKITELL